MPTRESQVTTARAAQGAETKRATLEMLRSKKPREKEIVVLWPMEDGSKEEISFLFRSIGAQAYDKLVGKYPPTIEQRADGGSFDLHKFAPALLAQVCVEPKLSDAEWKTIWDSPDWNRGEVMQFFAQAVELCSVGLDIPFTGRD